MDVTYIMEQMDFERRNELFMYLEKHGLPCPII